MYTLTTMVEFSSAHTFVGHSGPCKKMHGHNWKVEVEITGEKLDKIGMVVDFKEIRKATDLVVDELDHEFLNNLETFSEDNPTAENIARYIFTKLSEEFSNKNVKVNSIKLWETDKSAVSYKE